MLFGVEGLQVTDADEGADGTLEVWAVTDYPAAAACPGCGTVSRRVHETVVTRPRDVRRAGDALDLRWVKYRRKCENQQCPRKTFTEWVPALPPRCRITARLRQQAAHEIAERGITPAEAARHAGISWPSAHEAFAAAAGPLLDQPAAPVTHLGSMSTAAAGPASPSMSRPGSTSCSRIGGTPASSTCPAGRGCWARCKAAPPMTPRTG
jgi:transposase